MADRRSYYYREQVTEGELNDGFAALEQAERFIVADLGFYGINTGMVVTQHAGAPNLTVDVTAGSAYDEEGERIAVPAPQTVDLSVDSNNASTTVTTVGNARAVSLFVVFQRALSDPRIDGNGDTVYFVMAESYEWRVVMGAEAAVGAEVAPSLASDAILLADVQLLHGTAQILNAAINPYGTNRRQTFNIIAPVVPNVNALIAAYLAAAPPITNAQFSGTMTTFATQAVQSTGNARGKVYSNEADIATTDATVTTLFSWPILDECITTVAIQLSAIRADGSEFLSAGLRVVIQRDGGVVTVNAVDIFHNVPSTNFGGLAFTVDNSGSSGRVRVTGLAATSISWFCVVSRLEHTHP